MVGRWQNGKLVLSHFAGERPNLFEATRNADGTLAVSTPGMTFNHAVAIYTGPGGSFASLNLVTNMFVNTVVSGGVDCGP